MNCSACRREEIDKYDFDEIVVIVNTPSPILVQLQLETVPNRCSKEAKYKLYIQVSLGVCEGRVDLPAE